MSRALSAMVEDLFARVATGCPAAHDVIGARASGLTIAARFDDEAFWVTVGPAGPALCARPDGELETVRVEATLAALRDVMLGDVEVATALRDERLRVFGAPRELVRVDHLVRGLVAGAARTRGLGALLDEFLAKAASTQEARAAIADTTTFGG